MEDLRTLFAEWVAYERDSWEHKIYLLNSDECFREWVEEYYPERIDEVL